MVVGVGSTGAVAGVSVGTEPGSSSSADPAGASSGAGEASAAASSTTDAAASSSSSSTTTEGSSTGQGAPGSSSSESGETEDPGPLEHIAFITDDTFRGNLGGLAGADSQCELAAQVVGLPGQADGTRWVALLAASDVPLSTRVQIRGAVRNTAGELIAANATGFWAEERGAELLNEFGELPSTYEPNEQWTVTWAGVVDPNCDDWTMGIASSVGAIAVSQEGLWIEGGGADSGCNAEHALTCLSQPSS